MQHVCAVLQVLRDNSLFLKKSKCVFAEEKMHYLGHDISVEGVAMYQSKIDVVQAWPVPKTLRALRGFLGLTGYYRKFITNYGIIAAPLTALMKKEAFRSSPVATEAFNALKTALTTAVQPLFFSCLISVSTLWSIAMLQGLVLVLFFIRVKGQSPSLAGLLLLNTESWPHMKGNSSVLFKPSDIGDRTSGSGNSL